MRQDRYIYPGEAPYTVLECRLKSLHRQSIKPTSLNKLATSAPKIPLFYPSGLPLLFNASHYDLDLGVHRA